MSSLTAHHLFFCCWTQCHGYGRSCDCAIFMLPSNFSFMFLFIHLLCNRKFYNLSKSSTLQCFGIARANIFISRDHGDDCTITFCVFTQPWIIKNALNTAALITASGYLINIFSRNKRNYIYYINISNWLIFSNQRLIL